MDTNQITGKELPPAGAGDSECYDESLVEDLYNSLRDEVDYHCTFCQGLQMSVIELETIVRGAYVGTARSMKGLYDVKEIANRWRAMWLLSKEILVLGEVLRDEHQLCGADLAELQKYHDAAHERFLAHCPRCASASSCS